MDFSGSYQNSVVVGCAVVEVVVVCHGEVRHQSHDVVADRPPDNIHRVFTSSSERKLFDMVCAVSIEMRHLLNICILRPWTANDRVHYLFKINSCRDETCISSGLPVVLKFLKCHMSRNCPEVSNCPEILLTWSECPDIDLNLLICCHQVASFKAKMHQIRFRLGLRPRPCWGSLQHSPRLPPRWIWIVECKLNLLIKVCRQKNVHFLCLEPSETAKNVLKFSKNWVLKFHLLLLGALSVINSVCCSDTGLICASQLNCATLAV